jgi:hypothetical protein
MNAVLVPYIKSMTQGNPASSATRSQTMSSNNTAEINVESWCDSHQTSPEIAEAILWIAQSIDELERIWQNPTSGELQCIVERATRNGIDDAAELQWGDFTLQDVIDEAS